MADELVRRVGIIGIGGPNSVGYELGIKLYNECSRAGIPEGLLMYNRPPEIKGKLLKEHPELREELHKGHVFLEKMDEDLAFGSLCDVFRVPKTGRIINENDFWEMCYENKTAEKNIFARAYKEKDGLDYLLKETDSPYSVVVLSFEAAKGWYEWMDSDSTPPEKKVQIRRYLYYHNVTGAIEFAEALVRYAKDNKRPHQAHKIVVTNPPCRIMETIRMAAGKAAGPASKFSAYAAVDERRIFKEIYKRIKERKEYAQIQREYGGEIHYPLKNMFPGGRHAGNILIPGQERILNSTILWSAMIVGGLHFYDFFRGYPRLEQFKEDIERSAYGEFLKDLKKYGGRTTHMIIPTLSEIILDIMSNKEFSEFNKHAYTMGTVFKMPGTRQEFTFVWPVMYKEGHAWPFLEFDPLDVKNNIKYEDGKVPEVQDFKFIENGLRTDEVSKCYEICDDTVKPEIDETSEFLENPKRMKRVVGRHKNIFVIKGKFRPIISLDQLLSHYEKFLKTDIPDYCESYEHAMKMISNGCYDPNEVVNFIDELDRFEKSDNFHMTGSFISAMINNIYEPNLNLTLNLSPYRRIDGVGMYNRADLIIKGDLGNAAAMYMRDGSVIGENTLNQTCACQSGGTATFKQIGSYGGQRKKGGILEIRKAQNRLGQEMENGVIMLKGDCKDNLAYAMKGGKIIVEGDVEDNACDKMEGGTVILKGEHRDFGEILGGEVIWKGEIIK